MLGLVRRCCSAGLAAGMSAGSRVLGLRSRPSVAPVHGLGRGVAFVGSVWDGRSEAYDGVVIVGPSGDVDAVWTAATAGVDGPEIPEGVRVLQGAWIGPGVVDAHVHLAFGGPDLALGGGVVAVRDLGAPPSRVVGWRDGPVPVSAAGPVLTVRDGYPSTSWGADGFAAFLGDPGVLVRDLAADGVDLIKIALEPGAGLPVPTPSQVRAVVDAAHAQGLAVTAHALTVDMVARALDAGVDELAHIPVEVLPAAVIDRIADAGIPVVSTLQTFYAGGEGRGPGLNAAALVAAGVRVVYGTDLGNTGTRPGVDPRELDRLADAGLGRVGALRAATAGSARLLAGTAGDGTITLGEPARLVLLDHDPLVEPSAWRSPLAIVSGTSLFTC